MYSCIKKETLKHHSVFSIQANLQHCTENVLFTSLLQELAWIWQLEIVCICVIVYREKYYYYQNKVMVLWLKKYLTVDTK